MKKIYLLVLLALISLSNLTNAQNVNIPDANFKSWLVYQASINTNMDAEIQVSEASAFTGTINVNSNTISDLTGIEAFTALTILSCSYNQLTSLNLSSNTALTYLSCGNNSLTSLVLPSNSVLYYLDCKFNQLTNLTVSANTGLTELNCWSNSLPSLDVSANTALTKLTCNGNSLTSLNLSANTALTQLSCDVNSLTSLNVSANTALTQLSCQHNSLTSLDVSSNTALTQLGCGVNSLTILNVKNGNNINFTTFYANQNPNLTCIEVDNVAWATANWTVANTNIDATASFSENCSTSITEFANSYNLNIYPNPATNIITIETANANGIYQLCDLTGKSLLNGNVSATKFNVNVSSLAQGIYYLTLQTNEGRTTKKIEIVK